MSLKDYIKSWGGQAIRHIPDISDNKVYDFKYCALSRNNQWNVPGEPTLYLAKDKSVAIDDLSKWCLVIFLENLPENAVHFLPKAEKHGHMEIARY